MKKVMIYVVAFLCFFVGACNDDIVVPADLHTRLKLNFTNGLAEDSSIYSNKVVAVDGVAVTAGVAVFTGGWLNVQDSPLLDLSDKNFTIKFRLHPSSLGLRGIIGKFADQKNYWMIYADGSAKTIIFEAKEHGVTIAQYAFQVPYQTGRWRSYSLSREKENLYMVCENKRCEPIVAVPIYSTAIPNFLTAAGQYPIGIGRPAGIPITAAGVRPWAGMMDEICIIVF